MKPQGWRRGLGVIPWLLSAAALVLSFRLIPAVPWHGSAGWQLVYELIGAAIAVEVAAFALSRFGLEGQRVPLFIGLSYLGAAVADLVAALVCQGNHLTPLVGHTMAVVSVWTAGRWLLVAGVWAGLLAHKNFPTAAYPRLELVAATVIGIACSYAVVQFTLMVPLPGLVLTTGDVRRPWDLAAAVLLCAAGPGYWKLCRGGGAMMCSVLVSLLLGMLAQVVMARSAVIYDGSWNLAMMLKVVSYSPLLVGLFVESVTLVRSQKRLTAELRSAQEELSMYSKGLERQVAARTSELESRAKDLETFAYTVSHDLKAPLRGIQAYSKLLLDEYAGKLDGAGRRYAESVSKAAGTMKELIDDLLEYSRLERREIEMGPVDLRELIDSVIAERQSQIDQTHAQIDVLVAFPTVKGDRSMLRQATANLVDNALKYSHNARPPRIAIFGREASDEYMISFRDNGIGFDTQECEKIFEPFKRLHRGDEYEGTGIGLSIVKRAIEKHGGHVWAQSEPGKGATFTFAIPKQENCKS